MPLDESTLRTVVALEDSDTGEVAGTGFMVYVMSEHTPGIKHGYIVTATHVVAPHNSLDAVIMAAEDVSTRVIKRLTQWEHHPEYDVSVAPMPLIVDAPVIYTGSNFDTASIPEGVKPRPGGPAYFVGMFLHLDRQARRRGDVGAPVTRSGTVAAVNVPVALDPEGKVVRTLHLLDVRSFKGFSGSPVYIEMAAPGPLAPNQRYPDFAYPSLDPVVRRRLDTTYYWITLWGVLVSHFNDIVENEKYNLGLAVVVPIERVGELLHSEEMSQLRKAQDDEMLELLEEGAVLPENLGVQDPADYRREDFLEDLRKATRPLPPEQSEKAE